MKTRPHTLSVILIFTLAAGLLSVPQGHPADATPMADPPPSCVLRVNTTSAGGDGSTWNLAYNDLQTAIDTASIVAPCQVWVAKGTYKPVGYRLTSFLLENGVAVYGGFAGDEAALSQRDVESNETILSGDIGIAGSALDNAYNVVFIYGSIDNTAVLDGFTIRDGNANATYQDGGGIYIYGGSPTLANLKIDDNNASGNGGGVFVDGGSPIFSQVILQSNTANNGAGIYLTNHSNASLTNAHIEYNSATTAGGGLFNDATSTGLTLTAPVFIGNQAGHGGGGAYLSGHPTLLSGGYFFNNSADFGGGLFIDTLSGAFTLSNSTFIQNTAVTKGGGAYIYISSPMLTDVYFSENQSASFGGAIGNYESSPTLTNITLSRNTAPSGAGGGIYNSKSSHPVVRNSILWGDGGGEVFNDPGYTSSTITMTYSLAQGCKPGGGTWNTAACGTDGGNNVTDGDPMFKDPDLNNFRLKIGSPAINRGSNAFVSGVTTDLAGNPRISGGVVDLGPYEFPLYRAFVPVIKK